MAEAPAPRALEGKRIGLFVEYNVEDLELHYPALRLKEEGCIVRFIGPSEGFSCKGKYGIPAKADTAIDNITADDLDCLIVPGGFAPDYWRRDERFKKLVRDMHAAKKVIATICHGPWMLISAKICKGLNMTCFHAIKDDLENAGANYIEGQAVVQDGNVITSRTPQDLPEFCMAIIAQLKAQA
eukprot:m.11599 g.11599  ORF g.11599 m.11599 type:complete len:184 (+) comp5750_c0_seq1:101-652(+)